MEMKFVRPLALAAGAAILAVELIPSEHHKPQQHIESIRVAPAGQIVSNAANVVVSTPIMGGGADLTSLVVPESGRYFISVVG
jgi:hypothetical protein